MNSLYGILFLWFCQCCRTSSAFTTLPTTNRNRNAWTTLAAAASGDGVWGILEEAKVVDPVSKRQTTALDGVTRTGNIFESLTAMVTSNDSDEFVLVVVMPQLGDFDSAEYAELLASVAEDLRRAKITLRVIGIGDSNSAKRFADFSGLDLDSIRIDPTGQLHRSLNLKRGPNWDVPAFFPKTWLDWFSDYVGVADDPTRDSKAIFRSWLNYMAMCAGISSSDTLPEILRGYIGDKRSPERIRPDEVVTVGGTASGKDPKEAFIAITGTTDVKFGPFQYKQAWKDEAGYQRPLELATVRLRIMVEVLTNFAEYVPDQRHLDLRGATYFFHLSRTNDPSLVYKHIDTGVLSYSKTMGRPLSFLEPYIGGKALNPLGLGDINA